MKKIALKYGLWMFIGFTVFFLLMHILGLSKNHNLRVFNGIIHISMIYMAIRDFRSQNKSTVSNYVSGVAMGMYVSFIGVLTFALFQFFYLNIDEVFMQSLIADNSVGAYLTPFTASLFIFAEGIAISLIGSYILTRVIDMNLAKVQ